MVTATTRHAACALAVSAAVLAGCGGDDAGTTPMEEPDPLAVVTAKAGTYEGSWELFGRAATGEVTSAITWTDVAVADQPTLEETRAYVAVTDTMSMSDGSMLVQSWIEGVLIEPDGSVGPQFIDMDGVVTVLEEIAPDRFRYETPVSGSDFFFLEGITADSLVDGRHIVNKVVTHEGGQETHHITRTTHLEWNDDMGQLMVAEFESLSGTHHKTK